MTKEFVILLVDDDFGHTRLLEKNLRRLGLHNLIFRFENGQKIIDYLFENEAVHIKALKTSPMLLLLDIRMPQMDGIEALKRIKAHQEFCKIPVIMLTTTDDPKDIKRCYDLGCANYLVKPVDFLKFKEAISSLEFLFP